MLSKNFEVREHTKEHLEHKNIFCKKCGLNLCTDPYCDMSAHDNGNDFYCRNCFEMIYFDKGKE